MKVGGIGRTGNTFGPKVIRPRIVCGTPVPVGFIMMAVFQFAWNVTVTIDEDGSGVGGGSDIYSWLSLIADIQRGKSVAQKLMCNDGTI